MKINILIIFLFLISSLSAFPQTVKMQSKKDASDVPAITFSETEYDFGTIQSGAEALHYFVFSNTGKVPLVILNVRSACGCTVPAWPKTPVGAGMKDSLRVEYNTKIKGSFNKTITVQSNAPNAMVELKIKGNVVKAK
jgi:hypothetical protein